MKSFFCVSGRCLARCVRRNVLSSGITLQEFHGTVRQSLFAIMALLDFVAINNRSRTEWNPIRSVIITKSDNHEAGVRFVSHEYDYRLNWTLCPVTNLS